MMQSDFKLTMTQGALQCVRIQEDSLLKCQPLSKAVDLSGSTAGNMTLLLGQVK